MRITGMHVIHVLDENVFTFSYHLLFSCVAIIINTLLKFMYILQ